MFNASNPSSLNTAEPTIKACPSQSWTQERGSISPEQCCECSSAAVVVHSRARTAHSLTRCGACHSLRHSPETMSLPPLTCPASHACCPLPPAVTPPGHFTAGGVTSICPEGSFRADWVPPIQATACEFCGDSVLGDKSDRITVLDPVTGASSLLPVQTTAGDCCEFVLPPWGPGQGSRTRCSCRQAQPSVVQMQPQRLGSIAAAPATGLTV